MMQISSRPRYLVCFLNQSIQIGKRSLAINDHAHFLLIPFPTDMRLKMSDSIIKPSLQKVLKLVQIISLGPRSSRISTSSYNSISHTGVKISIPINSRFLRIGHSHLHTSLRDPWPGLNRKIH